jgi:hypothetical protein
MRGRRHIAFLVTTSAFALALIVVFLYAVVWRKLTCDEQVEQSIREYFDNLARLPLVQKSSRPPTEEEWAAQMDESCDNPLMSPYFVDFVNLDKEVRVTAVAILRRNRKSQAQEAIEVFRNPGIPPLLKNFLVKAAFEVGYTKDRGWEADNPIFEAVLSALEREENHLVRTWLIAVLVCQEDAEAPPYCCLLCSDEKAIRRLQGVSRAVRECDVPLFALIGFNAHRWADVNEWFDKNAPRSAKGRAYYPVVETVLGNFEVEKVEDVLRRVKEIGDDLLLSVTCYFLLGPVYRRYSDIEPDKTLRQDAEKLVASSIKPFVLEVAETVPFDDETEWTELTSRMVPGVLNDASYRRQRLDFRRMARSSACQVLGAIGDSECFKILEDIASNPKHDLLWTRMGAIRALGPMAKRNSDAAIESCLKIVVKNKNLPELMRAEALKNVAWLWVYGEPEQRFFERDKNFRERLEVVRTLLRQEVQGGPEGPHLYTLLGAIELMRFFDRETALQLLDDALGRVKDDAVRKEIMRTKRAVE